MAIRPYSSNQKDHYSHDGKALYIILRADRVFTLPVILSANGSICTEYVTENTWCCAKYMQAWELNTLVSLYYDVGLTSTFIYIQYESIKSQMPDRQSNPIKSMSARVKHETQMI